MLDDNLHCLVKNIQKQNRRKQTKKEKKKTSNFNEKNNRDMYINFVNKKQMKLIKKSLFEQNKMVFSWSWSCTEHTR